MRNRTLQVIISSAILIGCSNNNRELETNLTENHSFYYNEKSNITKLIDKEEKNRGIPNGLLKSISAVESNHSPYAVNAKNKSHNFKSKTEATRFVNTSISNGFDNMSIGCLQLHYKTHGKYFSSIEDMLQPENNIAYAANLLKKLREKYGSWEKAVKMYHTKKEKYNSIYYKKVMKKYKANNI